MINIIKKEISIEESLKEFNSKHARDDRIIKDYYSHISKDTREKYMDFSRELYTHGIIEDKEMFDIKGNYDYVKENEKDIEKDDFDISI